MRLSDRLSTSAHAPQGLSLLLTWEQVCKDSPKPRHFWSCCFIPEALLPSHGSILACKNFFFLLHPFLEIQDLYCSYFPKYMMPFDLYDQRLQCRENLSKARAEKKANEHFHLAQRMLSFERGGFTKSEILNKLPRTLVLLTLQTQCEFCQFFSA